MKTKASYSLTPIVFSAIATVVMMPFQRAQALQATEVSAIAESITVRIDGQNPGSGVIIKHQGDVYTVLTAAHVVETEDEYDVVTPDGQLHPLEYGRVKKLADVDLALVEFTSTKSYKTVELGDSAKIKSGELIYVSGFPHPTIAITESIWTFSEGKVTANAKRPLADGYALVYSNDTLPGMSGGAVLDTEGHLIGIHGRADSEQQVKRTETVHVKTGFNLGIPVNTFLSLAEISSPDLGFVGKPPEPASAALTVDDLFLLASNKSKKGDYQGAISDYDKAISLDPKLSDAYVNRGNAYYSLKQYSQAISDYDKAISLDPKDVVARGNRGRAYTDLKQYSQAILDYDKAISLDPQDAMAYKNRGDTYTALHQYSQAILDYDKSISLDPNYITNAYYHRGIVYNILKQYPQAISDFNNAIASNPDLTKEPFFYFDRGVAYLGEKKYLQAVTDWDESISLDPKFVDAYNNRGYAYSLLKKYSQAISDYDKAISLSPQKPLVYINRGNAYYAIGNKELTRENYLKAAQLYKQQNKLELYQKTMQDLQKI
ncbi:serine protease [Acaryochloris sp. 'Moss Beach']|uniref:tetratricopeptide repeat-containing S1 family peptidase n=1 Tax=Acaryochloris sp. 'Moss Beach' TaxID=2740837 RepID=UPI001F1C2D43|nr:tetratricopeptide repeat-containing serine protease family protein [Acaryochloris sp. 'Moss Beach']UJB68357.1 serine protease [Acaryochloris sp. 'Moss Beach']